jgi:hypothetical protein
MRLVVRLAAAALAVAAAGLVVPSPAQASTCSTASGVSVVVDFHQLGGGVNSSCDAGGAGKYAAQQFADVGHVLTYVDNEPFVCQVDGAPDRTCPRTPPADAYWSLWWSDGKSGTWSYASVGVTALKVPNGGYVALSWQGQSSQAKPRVAPSARNGGSPSPSPSHHPSSAPASGGPGQAPSSAPAPTTAPTTSATPAQTGVNGKQHADPSKGGRAAQDKPAHGNDRTEAAEPLGQVSQAAAREDGGSDSGGVPAWVAPVAIAVLFVGAGAIALTRRKPNGGA